MSTVAAARAMTAREWGLLFGLSILWGGSFFFIGVAVKALPPLTIVSTRVVLAALALHLLMRLVGASLPRSRDAWAAFFGMGLLNNVVPFLLIVWGQGHIASGIASVLNATTPLFAVVLAHFLTADERMSGARVAGVVAGLAGVAVMIGATGFGTLGVGVLSQLAVLAAALSYASAGIFGRRFRAMAITPLASATGQVTASSVLLLPVMLAVDRPWALPWPGMGAIGAVVALALLSTALAYIVYFRILATAGATNLTLVTFLIPVTAVPLGVLVLGETLLVRHGAGMALIALGLAAVDGRVWRLVRRHGGAVSRGAKRA